MDIVLLFNGLGNQMSQYAFYLAKKQYNLKVRYLYFPDKDYNQHNGFELERIFNIKKAQGKIDYCLYWICRYSIENKNIKGKILRRVLKYLKINMLNEVVSYDYDYSHLIKRSTYSCTFYKGGWHSEKYFANIKDTILDSFRFRIKANDTENIKILEKVHGSTSVSIHIRRGDFISDVYEFFGKVCDRDYYQKAINYIKNNVENSVFFIFSNDINWVKENLILENSIIVDVNNGDESWKDMYLMSQCKHNVNANSSFSWWGAWLNTNPDKIIVVPTNFISHIECKDIYPESWIKI